MLRLFLAFAGAVLAARALGEETCADATRTGSCVTTLATSDHSLLQVHPASTVAAAKRDGPSGNEPVTKMGIELQQEKTNQGQHQERSSLNGKGKKVTSRAATDPYPEDYDLDTDYPRDDKGTHADTIREVQSATLPGDGDTKRITKPGLTDSWNVDTMFVTDSDGGGHVSLRDMIPWGYRSQTQAKEAPKNRHTDDADKSGLLSEGKTAREETDEHINKKRQMTKLQRHKDPQASKTEASNTERDTPLKHHHDHAVSDNGPASGETKNSFASSG